MNCGIVIIPTYNEIENIESIVRAVFSLHKPFHVLIVDDNSPVLGTYASVDLTNGVSVVGIDPLAVPKNG